MSTREVIARLNALATEQDDEAANLYRKKEDHGFAVAARANADFLRSLADSLERGEGDPAIERAVAKVRG